MRVLVNALLVHYEQSGTGKTVLLLHGWGDTSAGLHDLQTALSKHYRVIAIDLPGFGNSQAPPSPWGLDEYGQFTQAFLRKIGAGELRAVIGHSNGGAIAIRAAAKGWLQPERIVLLAAAGIRGLAKAKNTMYRLVAKTGKVAVKPLPTSLQKRLRNKLYTTIGSDMLVVETLEETFKRVVSDDVRADAATITVPTLLIYGESDTQTPLVYGQQYHELIADSTLEVLPGVGHFVHLERPEIVTTAIERFLA
jgi:pimeloyl-ACP methyl ester carboxylesterase